MSLNHNLLLIGIGFNTTSCGTGERESFLCQTFRKIISPKRQSEIIYFIFPIDAVWGTSKDKVFQKQTEKKDDFRPCRETQRAFRQNKKRNWKPYTSQLEVPFLTCKQLQQEFTAHIGWEERSLNSIPLTTGFRSNRSCLWIIFK